jgi:hypothetical protein
LTGEDPLAAFIRARLGEERAGRALVAVLRTLVDGWTYVYDPDDPHPNVVAASGRDDMETLAEAWRDHPDWRAEWPPWDEEWSK